jgi:hypothetical protein
METPVADPEDFLARYRQEEEKRSAKAREAIRYLSGALRLMGVRTVTAPFDGYGDEGNLGDLTYDPLPPAGFPEGLCEVLAEAFCELLPGGWEINGGSFGTVTLDTATGEVEIDQEWRDEDELAGEDP